MRLKLRKKILVLTSTYPLYPEDGMPGFVGQLCSRLADELDIIVVAPHTKGAKRRENKEGVSVYRHMYAPESWESLAYNRGIVSNIKQKPARYLLVPFFLLSQLWSAALVCKREKIDAIHAHWILPQGLVGVILSRLFGIPLLITSHGSDLYGLKGPLWQWTKKWVVRRCAHIAAVSEDMRTKLVLLGVPEKGASVAPMGVDLQKTFVPDTSVDRDFRILFVGRLVSKKGLIYMIEAMAKIMKRHPGVILDVVGDGPEMAELCRAAEAQGVDGNVVFHGKKTSEEIVKFCQKAIIFVLPSEEEGLGLVAIEAMGCGCPVVASDLPAMRDVVEDRVTGLLFRSADSNDLAHKVEELIEDPGLRCKLADKGRVFVVSKFDWDISAGRYKRLFESLVKEENVKALRN